MTTIYPNNIESDDEVAECGNGCGWEGTVGELGPLRDVQERISAGEFMPAGECPECGACAHLTDEAIARVQGRPGKVATWIAPEASEAVRSVLAYNWDDEERDFREQGRPKSGHIFLALQTLAREFRLECDTNGRDFTPREQDS